MVSNMTFKRPRPVKGQIIELETDPAAENSGYDVTSGTLWLNVSVSPAVLNERNSTNTGWNPITVDPDKLKQHSFGMNVLFGI